MPNLTLWLKLFSIESNLFMFHFSNLPSFVVESAVLLIRLRILVLWAFVLLFIYSYIHQLILYFVLLFIYSSFTSSSYSFIHLFIQSYFHIFIYSYIHPYISQLQTRNQECLAHCPKIPNIQGSRKKFWTREKLY